jgi:hypothetical protein
MKLSKYKVECWRRIDEIEGRFDRRDAENREKRDRDYERFDTWCANHRPPNASK